jgi:hypothetical protein
LSDVTAEQRQDASKLVDINYSLSYVESADISVEVSDNDGDTWSIIPTALEGDVGENIPPGDDKHIIWNPSIDIPGVSDTSFVVKVIADSLYYGISNMFAITAAGPGDLYGQIFDATTGDSIPDVEVTVADTISTLTEPNGFYLLPDLPAGISSLTVNKEGYYTIQDTVLISETSATMKNIMLTPNQGFGITQVYGKFCSPTSHAYYLDDVKLNELFTATIEWEEYIPGIIRWITPQGTYEEPCPDSISTKSFNMVREFGHQGTLALVAVTDDYIESAPYYVNFDVIPSPLGVPYFLLRHDGDHPTLRYEQRDDITLRGIAEGVDEGEIPDDIPGFGDSDFELVSIPNLNIEVLGLQYPEEPYLHTLQLYLLGGIRIVLFIFTYEEQLIEYTWDINENRLIRIPSHPVLRIYPREYIHRGRYATFVANEGLIRRVDASATIEILVQENVFPRSTPDLAPTGEDVLFTWVYDDTTRTPVNRTEAVFSAYDSESHTWTDPAAVADDSTADFHPALVRYLENDAFLAWENVKEVLEEPEDPEDSLEVAEKLEEMKSKTEIAVARYDGMNTMWEPQTVLTDNLILDRSPHICGAQNGTAMVTWVSNAANHEFGTATEPNIIHSSVFDGVSWSMPQEAATDVPSVIKSAMAYNGTDAIILFIGDTDDSTQTVQDRELFALEYTDGTWDSVIRLTDDSAEDANPQLVYDYTDTPLLVWYNGGDIVMANDPDLSDRRLIVDLPDDASSGGADFRLATGPEGQIALVWQETNEGRLDMWTACYDPIVTKWSKPLSLTDDYDMEYAMAPAFSETGDLIVGYDKARVVYETRTVEIGGKEIEVDVPVPEQVDLYVLRHQTSGDLTVSEDDVSIDPPNPVTGDCATVSATVHNLGDIPAIDLDVAFWDGDPEYDGSLIGTTTLADTLVGGDTTDAAVEWLVP